MPQQIPLPPNSPEEEEIKLTDLLLVLLRRKMMIVLLVVLAIVVSVILSLQIPNKYTATARILPPRDSTSSGISGILSQAGTIGGLASQFIGGGKSTSDIYVGIMQSRTVADTLIKKFDLQKHYGQTFRADVYLTLTSRTKFEVSPTAQIVSVSVEDVDRERAAQMANTYIEALDQINRTVNTNEGQRKRVFLEKRLQSVKEDLARAETTLKEFQEKYKVVAIEEQAKATIGGAAAIIGQIIAAQTELEVLKQFGTERQNEAVMLSSKVEELQRHLSRMESGNPGKDVLQDSKMGNQGIPGFYIPFDDLPNLGLQLVRLMREAKVQEEVFKLLTSQFEVAKIEEAKDVNTIQVLDRAVPPDKKSGPKRGIIVIASTVAGFFVAVFIAFFLEYLQRVRTNEPDLYRQVAKHLRFRKKQ
ncbi:MAG: lipopolysaccharide biosynthesis protein [Deltaproteobacteria bacterium HGW-Deltaproteobacteria-15]|jgi:uncharacterized protein involved in exopolysaccharide biosynthesis|nr:MAG: lipopolysaccharide biosynthesis protein [Deltaproteobacteria bacterium HGW-Deltaproteobacteria-15]